MGKPNEADGVALASQRDFATDVLYRCGIVDNEIAHLDDDNRHHIRRALGYTKAINIRCHAMIGGLGVPCSLALRVVNPPKPPWYNRRWFRFIASQIVVEAVKWAGGGIIEGFRELFRGRLHAPSQPTR